MTRINQPTVASQNTNTPTLALVVAVATALIAGISVPLLGGIIPLVVLILLFGIGFVLADYRVGVWLLTLLLPFAATLLVPHQVLGVPGLNPVNALLLVTIFSLFIGWAFKQQTLQLVSLSRPLLAYMILICVAAYVGAGSAHRAIILPGISLEPLTVSKYLQDNVAKPLIMLVVAWLAAVQARNGGGRVLIWALATSFVLFFLVVVGGVVVNGLTLQGMASSSARGFLSWTGMHANELGLLFNMGFALLLFASFSTAQKSARVILFICATAAALTAALTFSRGAFLGLAIVIGYFLLSRRRLGQMTIGLVLIVVIGLLLPDAFMERATTGLQSRDTGAISAGRLDDIWLPLMPTFWEAPIIGHGLSSTLWATPNLRGAMLPVGHPHSAYLGVLLDLGLVGVVVVATFFFSMWRLFRNLSRVHPDPQWRGIFEGSAVGLLVLAIQGLTDDRFVPTYSQVVLWLAYGLALGNSRVIVFSKGQK